MNRCFWGMDLTLWGQLSLRSRPAGCIPAAPAKEIHSLAIVEDDGTVGPAVMVGLAEVGEDSHTNSLQSSLVTEGKAVAVDLVPKHRQEEALKEKKLNSATFRVSQFPRVL